MRRIRLRRLILYGLVSLCPCRAQTPAPAPRQPEPEVVTHQSPATFSSRVNLVSVPVVVRDKEGHTVGGLRQEDFQLFDKGKPQVITKFSIQTEAEAVSAKPAGALLPPPVAKEDQDVAPLKPALPDRYVAYFFDDIHMKPEDLVDARKAANQHLDKALDSGMRAGIFTTSGRTSLAFTDDVAKLHETVNKIQPWTPIVDKTACLQMSYYIADVLVNREHSISPVMGINPSSPLAVEIATEAAACFPGPDNPNKPTEILWLVWQTANLTLTYGLEETQSTFSVLTNLIAKMSALPGTRTVVLVSPGFFVPDERRFEESQILDRAVRANVVVNSLDIRGVSTPLRTRTFDTEYGGNFGGPPNTAASLYMSERFKAEQLEQLEAGNLLAELAYGTGGTVHNDNDFEGGLQQLASRPEYLYVLGFSPDNLKNDGSYHGLKVKLKEGGSKFEIEARRGYWAPSRAVDPGEAAREELKETFFSRDEISDIPLDLHADFFKPSSGRPEINVVARLDARALKFRKVDDRNNDTLTVVTGLFDQNGNYISGIERVVEMRLQDRSLQVLDNAGVTVEQSFPVMPGRYIVRVVVKDSEGQTTAARNAGIEVP